MPVISPSALSSPVSRAVAANDAAASVPAVLREKVRRLERANSAQRRGRAASVKLGIPAIDALLPEGGLLTGALHEIEAGPGPSGRVAPHDGAAMGFAAHLLGRFGPGTILWCRHASGPSDATPYAPALSSWFDPARLLMVMSRRDEDLFWAMEEGLRCPGIAAVLGETRAADPTAGRRLSLAAEKSGVPALLLRAQPGPPQSVCATRWRIISAPSASTPGLTDVGAARWRVELRRNRFGTPSADEIPSWLVEWNDETHCLAVVPQALHGPAGARFEERLVG
ncbi:damage-inducible mutagenesis protein [Reyranella sp. MMS21-HV4-11]|uniref:Damage-inducible mutagenesis protein n=1 Tax=Reyranella humidisoli TaxID=2849149 RepID=A0ABS6IQP9_9HYPH|nr:damage-inducible mutagenesis protein [Reyranella sp. MMS21-HV4-11]MBU8876032.1 damage-inducible mutagenesis protein [Reyranella sp. MMS21-HV4-11]